MLPPKAKLLGTTKRLKQLIKEHGDEWVVLDINPEPMQCFNGALGVRIATFDDLHVRNVRLSDLDLFPKV